MRELVATEKEYKKLIKDMDLQILELKHEQKHPGTSHLHVRLQALQRRFPDVSRPSDASRVATNAPISSRIDPSD